MLYNIEIYAEVDTIVAFEFIGFSGKFCFLVFFLKAGVPQGNALGPMRYWLFTADLPTTNKTSVTHTAVTASRTAILATASTNLQDHLNPLQVM